MNKVVNIKKRTKTLMEKDHSSDVIIHYCVKFNKNAFSTTFHIPKRNKRVGNELISTSLINSL